MAKLVGSDHAASCAQFLPYSLTKAFGVYAVQAVETLILYSCSISSSVILLKALPATLTNSNCFFMLVDIPSKKHASSLRIYSLKVTPCHLPIFWICVSVYPARESAIAPPLLRECVSSLAIGVPFVVGYSRAVPAHLMALLTSSLVTSDHLPPSSK